MPSRGMVNTRRVSTVVVQRFCKPKVAGSNPAPGILLSLLIVGDACVGNEGVIVPMSGPAAAGPVSRRMAAPSGAVSVSSCVGLDPFGAEFP